MDAAFHWLGRALRVCRGAGVSLVAGWCLASVVQAQTCQPVPRWCYTGGGYATPQSECRTTGAAAAQAYALYHTAAGEVCQYQLQNYQRSYVIAQTIEIAEGWIQARVEARCGPSPVEFTQANVNFQVQGTMEPDDCAECAGRAGEETTINMTYGYARVPNAGNLAGDGFERSFVGPVWMAPANPTNYCYQGCEVRTDRSRASMAWESRAPTSEGLYRWSADYTSTYTGAGCADGQSEATNPQSQQTDAPMPSCDGAQGTVNGKPVCIAQNPPAQPHPPELGGAPTVTGNPTAGESPTGGTQGRVPPTGNGGPAGGPAMPGDGQLSEGDGTGTLPTNPGTGSGPGTVPDPEPGECEANPSAAGCGGNPAGVGQLYTGKGKTWEQVIGTFRDSLMASPIGMGVGGFFTVALGGTCPTWTWSIPFVNATATLDMFCTSMANTVFLAIRAVLLVIAGWFAFRVAIGD